MAVVVTVGKHLQVMAEQLSYNCYLQTYALALRWVSKNLSTRITIQIATEITGAIMKEVIQQSLAGITVATKSYLF